MIKENLALRNYDVDEYGVVSNRSTGEVLLLQKTKKGYLGVGLYFNGKKHFVRVHRLVAVKYLPNPFGYPEVNHKDLNKENNYWDNLEWCTDEMNREHAKVNGISSRKGENNRNATLRNEDIVTIRKRISEGETFKGVYKSYSDQVSWWAFRDICRGNSWKGIGEDIIFADADKVNAYGDRVGDLRNKVPEVSVEKTKFSLKDLLHE